MLLKSAHSPFLKAEKGGSGLEKVGIVAYLIPIHVMLNFLDTVTSCVHKQTMEELQ
jgi:hypothetical protein